MTRNGLKIMIELSKKGWKPVPLCQHEIDHPEEMVIGNPDVIDPLDGKVYRLAKAKEIQDERDKANERPTAD